MTDSYSKQPFFFGGGILGAGRAMTYLYTHIIPSFMANIVASVRFWVPFLSLRNGTFLNGKRLPPKASAKVMLSHGDELLLQAGGRPTQATLGSTVRSGSQWNQTSPTQLIILNLDGAGRDSKNPWWVCLVTSRTTWQTGF